MKLVGVMVVALLCYAKIEWWWVEVKMRSCWKLLRYLYWWSVHDAACGTTTRQSEMYKVLNIDICTMLHRLLHITSVAFCHATSLASRNSLLRPIKHGSGFLEFRRSQGVVTCLLSGKRISKTLPMDRTKVNRPKVQGSTYIFVAVEWRIGSTFDYDARGPRFDSRHAGLPFLEAIISLISDNGLKTLFLYQLCNM